MCELWKCSAQLSSTRVSDLWCFALPFARNSWRAIDVIEDVVVVVGFALVVYSNSKFKLRRRKKLQLFTI